MMLTSIKQGLYPIKVHLSSDAVGVRGTLRIPQWTYPPAASSWAKRKQRRGMAARHGEAYTSIALFPRPCGLGTRLILAYEVRLFSRIAEGWGWGVAHNFQQARE